MTCVDRNDRKVMRAIVTRPEPFSSAWVASLQQAGVAAVACPLIEIKPLAFAWPEPGFAEKGLPPWDAFMWVSRSAVAHFPHPLPAGAWHLAPGLGTAQSLLATGVLQDRVLSPPPEALQFDSETLWRALQERGLVDWTGRRVLVVRGQNHLGEDLPVNGLAKRLMAQGAEVALVSVYQRALPQRFALPVDVSDVRDVWLCSSSESLLHLQQLQHSPHLILPSAWQGQSALCTHPRIAEVAARLGFEPVAVCRPELGSVVASLRDFPRHWGASATHNRPPH